MKPFAALFAFFFLLSPLRAATKPLGVEYKVESEESSESSSAPEPAPVEPTANLEAAASAFQENLASGRLPSNPVEALDMQKACLKSPADLYDWMHWKPIQGFPVQTRWTGGPNSPEDGCRTIFASLSALLASRPERAAQKAALDSLLTPQN